MRGKDWKRKLAAVMAVVMMMSNITGDLAVLANTPTGSNANPEETTSLEGSIMFLEDGEHRIDRGMPRLAVYRNGKLYRKAKIVFDKEGDLLASGSNAGKRATDSDSEKFILATDSNAAEVSRWEFTVDGLPLYDRDGNEYVYTVRDTRKSDACAVLYENSEGELDKLNAAKEEENVTDFLYIPYVKISGGYRAVDGEGTTLKTLPDEAAEFWKEQPLKGEVRFADELQYPEKLRKDIPVSVKLSGSKTYGVWTAEKILAFDPVTFEKYVPGVALVNNAPDFEAFYRSAVQTASNAKMALDGEKIENVYQDTISYGARLRINWNGRNGAGAGMPAASLVRIFDGEGREVTDSVEMTSVETNGKSTSELILAGLQKECEYSVTAGPVDGFRPEQDEVRLYGSPMARDGQNGEVLFAGAEAAELTMTQTKDVMGVIRWNDQKNSYGIRPEKDTLSGLVSGAPEVLTVEDVSVYVKDEDSGEQTSVYVSEEEDMWKFVVTNLDWDEELLLPEVKGYAVRREPARPAGLSRMSSGNGQDEPVVMLTASVNKGTVTLKNQYFSDLSYGGVSQFKYKVTIKEAGGEEQPFSGSYFYNNSQHTTGDGILSVPPNATVTFEVDLGSEIKILQEKIAEVYAYGGLERTVSDLQGNQTFSFANTDKHMFSYVNKNWNDNGNEHKNRKVNSSDSDEITQEITQADFASYLILYYVKENSYKEVLADDIKEWKADAGIVADAPAFGLDPFSTDANWVYSANNLLPKFDQEGNKIQYAIGEPEGEFDGYFTEKALFDGGEFLLVNTHKYEFTAEKVWKDDTYGATARPDMDMVRSGLVLHRKVMNYDGGGQYPEEIEYDFSKSFEENRKAYSEKYGNSHHNRWDYEPELEITEDPTDADLWKISIKNLPEYDDVTDKGFPYLYYLTEKNVPVKESAAELKNAGVHYEPKYTNIGNHSAETEVLFEGGTLTNTMVGDASMTFTKEWRDKDGDPAARPKTGTFELLRYPKDLPDANWMTASPVPGFKMIPVATNVDRKTYKIAAEDMADVTDVLALDRFDENGREYVYFVKERGIGGNYEQKIINGPEFKDYAGSDRVVFNEGVIWNKLTEKVNKTVTKKWEAKAYQELRANVNLTLTREKKRTNENGNLIDKNGTLIPDGEGKEQWVFDEEFNKSADAAQRIDGFLAEVMEKTVTVSGLDQYDEWGRKYRYGLSETSIEDLNANRTGVNAIPVADDKFVMGGHHFEVVEETDSTNPDHHLIVNRLVDKTDLKIRKVWESSLTDAQLSGTPKPTVVIRVTRNDDTAGYVKFEYSGTAAKPEAVVTVSSNKNGPYKAVGVSEIVCKPDDRNNKNMISEAVICSLGTDTDGKPVELDKYDSNGREYIYKVEEVSMTPDSLNAYSSRYSYEAEKRTKQEEIEKYGENRRVAVTTNYKGVQGEYIHVSKEWLDGYDMAHRGNVVAALQIYQDGQWKFVDKTAKGDDGKAVYDQTTENPDHYYTVTMNDGNNWEGWFTINGETVAEDGKAAYYNRYRVLEIEAGLKPEGYSYSQDKAQIKKDLTMPAEHENLIEYYASGEGGLKYGLNDSGFYQPVGMLKSADHYYKVTTTANSGAVRNDYTLTNLRIAMVKVTFEKTWQDRYVVSHPSITVELSRTMQDEALVPGLDNTKDLGMAETGETRSKFPFEKVINNWSDHTGSGQFLNLPKYDGNGELYEYSLQETKIGDQNISGGQATIEIETEGPFSDAAEKETVTYNKAETFTYEVGKKQHTEDVKHYQVTNQLAEAITSFTVHKVWKDDRTEEAKKKRPDLYLNLWRSTYEKKSDGSGEWVETKELMDGDQYVDREWKTVDADTVDQAHEYHWSCGFDALPQYDSSGNKYYYSAEEIMRTPGDYVALYFGSGARDPVSQDITMGDDWAAIAKVLNDGMTFQEFGEANGLDEAEAKQKFSFAPEDGTIVNIPRATVYIEGKKYFENMVNTMKIKDYPEITLELHRRLLKDSSGQYEIVEADDENGKPAPVRAVLSPEADGTQIPSYSFGKKDGTTGALPKYDKDGNEYAYAVSEVQINGEDIYGPDGTVNADKTYFGWVKDSHDFIITNRYMEKKDLKFKANKRWVRPADLDPSVGYPEITVHLNRAMTDGPENDNWNLLLYTVPQEDAPDDQKYVDTQTVTVTNEAVDSSNGIFEVTFTDLLTYAPNGYKYYYWISEEKTNGYSCENAVDDLIWAAKKDTTAYPDGKLQKLEITTAESKVSDANFVNSYQSRDAGDYVTFSGEKTWVGDNGNRFKTRWDRENLKLELWRYASETVNSKGGAVKVADANFEWNAAADAGNSEHWKFSFTGNEAPADSGITGFFKYAPDGQAYHYFVKEYYDADGTGSGTFQEVPGSGTGTDRFAYIFASDPVCGVDKQTEVTELKLNAVNTLDAVSLKVEKTWVDQNNMYDTRPKYGGLKMYVQRRHQDGNFGGNNNWENMTGADRSEILMPEFTKGTGENTWTSRMNALPKYDAAGRKYEYRVVEKLEGSETAAGTKLDSVYTVEYDPVTVSETLLTAPVTNTRISSVADSKFSAKKVWDDEGNRDGLRPDGIRFVLYRKVGSDGPWKELQNTAVNVTAGTTQDKNQGINGISFDARTNSDEWKVTWHNLPSKTPDGSKEVFYMAVEAGYSYDAGANWTSVTVTAPAPGVTYKVNDYYQAKNGGAGDNNENLKPVSETGSDFFGFTVTNHHTPIKVNATVEKEWAGDQNDLWSSRPDHVTVGLFYAAEDQTAPPNTDKVTGSAGWLPYSDKSGQKKAELTAENSWKDETTFVNLPFGNGKKPYRYAFFELDENGNPKAANSYTAMTELQAGGRENNLYGAGTFVSGEKYADGSTAAAVSTVITNTLRTTSLEVTKIWQDNDDRYGMRPEGGKVQIQLQRSADGGNWKAVNIVDSTDLSIGLAELSHEAKYTFKGLPMMDKAGKPYRYRAVEVGESDGKSGPYQVGYVHENPAAGAEGPFTTKITNTLISDGSIAVSKVWEDGDNRDAKRPDNLTFWLISTAGNTPLDRDNITKPQKSVYIQTITPDANGNWPEIRWERLPKYDVSGTELHYYVYEALESGSVYTPAWKWADTQTVSGALSPELTPEKTGADPGIDPVIETASVTNSYIPRTVTIDMEKSWKQGDGTIVAHPGSVTVVLQRKTAAGAWEKVSSNSAAAGYVQGLPQKSSAQNSSQEFSAEQILSSSNGWKNTWENLPAYENKSGKASLIEYRIVETPVNGYSPEYQVNSGEKKSACDSMTGNDSEVPAVHQVSVSNDADKTTLNVEKTWNDGNNQYDTRRDIWIQLQSSSDGGTSWEDVKDQLKEDGTVHYQSIVKLAAVSDSDLTVEYTYGSLPKNDAAGEEYSYRAVELIQDANGVPKLQTDPADKTSGAYLTSDGSGISYDAVQRIQIQGTNPAVYEGSLEFAKALDENAAGGKYSHNGAYEVTYVNSGTADTGYATEITNTLIRNRTSLNVKKQWADGHNRDLTRPDSLTFYLLDLDLNGTEAENQTKIQSSVTVLDGQAEAGSPYIKTMIPDSGKISEAWTGTVTWKDLPAYRKDGSECRYYVYEKLTDEKAALYKRSWSLDGVSAEFSDGILSPEVTPKGDPDAADITVTAKNTYDPMAMEITAVKKWESTTCGTIETRPESVKVRLQRKISETGDDAKDWKDVSAVDSAPGYVSGLTPSFETEKTLDDSSNQDSDGNWTVTWENLPVHERKVNGVTGGEESVKIRYRIVENDVTGYKVSYDYDGKPDQESIIGIGAAENGTTGETHRVTITNTMEPVSWKVEKEFRGLSSGDKKPDRIYGQLQYRQKTAADGTAETTDGRFIPVPGVERWFELGASGNSTDTLKGGAEVTYGDWTAEISGLPKYEYVEDGGARSPKELEYRFAELKSDKNGNLILDENGNPEEGAAFGYQSGSKRDEAGRTTTLINSLKIILSGEKAWEDFSNLYQVRPDTVKFTVYRGVMDVRNTDVGTVTAPAEKYAEFTVGSVNSQTSGETEDGVLDIASGAPLDGVNLQWTKNGDSWSYVVEGLERFTDGPDGPGTGENRYFYYILEEDEDVPGYYERAEQPDHSDLSKSVYFGNAPMQKIKNSLVLTDLKISKTWKGDSRFPETGKEDRFKFQLQYRENPSETWADYTGTYRKNGGSQDEICQDGTVSIRGGEHFAFELPSGFEYRVEELPGNYDKPYPHSYKTRLLTGTGETFTTVAEGTVRTDAAGKGVELEFENQATVETGSLSLEKTVSGNKADMKKEFTFTIVLTYPDGAQKTETRMLAHGSKVTLENLPAGTRYKITEDSGDYRMTVTAGDLEGVIGKGETASVKINNEKDYPGILVLKKTLSGNAAEDGDRFDFTVEFSGPKLNKTVTFTLGKDETVTFGENGTYLSDEKIPLGTTYRITEKTPDGYEMSVAEGALTGTFTKETPMVSVTVNNRKHYPGTLTLKKTVSGTAPYKDETFHFEVLLKGTWGMRNYQAELGKDQEFFLDKIPSGTEYKITEDTPDGYTMTVSEGTLEGLFTEEKPDQTVVIDNRKDLPDDDDDGDGGNGGGNGGGGGSGGGTSHKVPVLPDIPNGQPLLTENILPNPVPGANIDLDIPGDTAPHREINRLPKTGQTEDGPGYETDPAPVKLPETLPKTLPETLPETLPGAVPDVNSAYKALYEQNHDMTGWISLPGTQLDYPVMFTPNDPEFYLHRDFQKQQNFGGLPFVGEGCTPDSMNVILHGHNMKNGSAFASLLYYKDASFYRSHPTITFNTLTQNGEYEIIGVFRSQVYPENAEGVFKFYQWSGDMNKDQFYHYVEEVKKASLYDTGKTAEYGDQLITLTTCAYHVTDGRFVVVARKKGALAAAAAEVERRMAVRDAAAIAAGQKAEPQETDPNKEGPGF